MSFQAPDVSYQRFQLFVANIDWFHLPFDHLCRRAQKFIEEHSGEELSLSKVAKAVNIHPNYLSERFRQITGMKFVEYVTRTRFERACGLLHNGDTQISEIAFAVGFQSLSQFNRVFKRLSGKSPRQYRAAKRVVPGHASNPDK